MISEEEKDAIDVLEDVFIFKNTNNRFTKLDLKCINIALNLIETQNKMIELMAEFMNKRSWKEHQVKDDTCYCCKTEYGSDECKQCIIEYFRNKAKESE